MPREKLLSGEQAGQVTAYHREGSSNRWIAKALERSKKGVRFLMANRIAPRARKKAGRHPKMTKREICLAFRLAIHDSLSSRQITVALDSKPHYTTVINALHSTKFAMYAKHKPRPAMKPHHKESLNNAVIKAWDEIDVQ